MRQVGLAPRADLMHLIDFSFDGADELLTTCHRHDVLVELGGEVLDLRES